MISVEASKEEVLPESRGDYEILIIRIFRKLLDQFSVRIVIFFLDDQSTENHTERFATLLILLGILLFESRECCQPFLSSGFIHGLTGSFVCEF